MAIVRNLATVKTTADITSSATSIPVNRVDVFGTSQTTLDNPFYVTIMPASGDEPANSANSEIVLVTGISGLNLTVTRGQRSTTAKAFNSGAIVTMGIYAEDAVLLGDGGTAVGTPAPWIETSDIKNGAVTTDKIADGAVKSSKIDWTTSTLWSGKYYSIGASTAQTLSQALDVGRLYVIEVIGLSSSSWKMQFPFIYTGDRSIQFAYYDGSSYARWRVTITPSASGFYLDPNSTNMSANTAITRFMRVM